MATTVIYKEFENSFADYRYLSPAPFRIVLAFRETVVRIVFIPRFRFHSPITSPYTLRGHSLRYSS